VTLPLRVELTLPETALPGERRVSLRVLRFAATLAFGQAGGSVAFALPVAVVDREVEPPRTIGVVDYNLLAGLLLSALPLLGLLVRRRRS
jgi:hypothetical protein